MIKLLNGPVRLNASVAKAELAMPSSSAYGKKLAHKELFYLFSLILLQCLLRNMPSRCEVSFRQPATDLRPEFLMGDTAYGKAHVPYWEHKILFVGTTNMFQQWQAGVGMDHVIVLADNIQHRTSDMAKVNAMLTYLQLATEKLVLPKEIDTQFVKQSTG